MAGTGGNVRQDVVGVERIPLQSPRGVALAEEEVVIINGVPQPRYHGDKRPSIEQKHQQELQGLPEREKWSNKFEFFLSCVGYSVGLGNIWRFPYLCYKNGGGAFLIPYCISLIFCGVPMFILEASWGQLLSIGGLGIWKLCPILKGVGWAAVVMAFWLNIYYIVVLSWGLYYFVKSFTLPWSKCDEKWSPSFCRDPFEPCKNYTQAMEYHYGTNASNINESTKSYFLNNIIPDWKVALEAEGRDVGNVGTIRWELALTLLLAWVFCYFAIFKGVKWTGKVVYFTALFPYVLLFILFCRGVSLKGAGQGIYFYIFPDMAKLANSAIWIDAVSQIFFTYGLALGAIVALGSYNPYHNSIVNGTSFFSGFVIFSFLGFLADQQGLEMKDVVDKGPGLLFLVYPTGLLKLWGTHFWSCLFFFMILLIGIDSQFCTMEGFCTALIDEFPRLLRGKWRREIFIAIISVISYLIGLSMVTQGGIYVFELFNYFAASGWCLLWLMFFECIAISWLYGVNKWYDHLQDMIGYKPSIYWKFCWVIMCPVVCAAVMIFSLVQYAGATYKDKPLPPWSQGVGWLMALSSMLCVPAYAIYAWTMTPGPIGQRIRQLVHPDINVRAFREGGTEDHFAAVERRLSKAQPTHSPHQEFHYSKAPGHA